VLFESLVRLLREVAHKKEIGYEDG